MTLRKIPVEMAELPKHVLLAIAGPSRGHFLSEPKVSQRPVEGGIEVTIEGPQTLILKEPWRSVVITF